MNPHKMCIPIFLIGIFFIAPCNVFASVVINEVAWMGTENSSFDEWIELYNNGGNAVDLTGWILKSIDDTPTIELIGTIGSKSFFLLERKDDTSVPSVMADLIYVGTLSNGGEFLKLFNGSGFVEDMVDGLDGWNIGGNNTTKETLQRISSGWSTKTGTPKSANESMQEVIEEDVLPEDNTPLLQIPQTNNIVVTPIGSITIRIKEREKVATVGVQTEFNGFSLGLKNEPLLGARYLWNFGDGGVGEGENIVHTYHYIGEYNVIVDVSSGRYTASARMRIKIVKAQIEISGVGAQNDSFIELYNKSPYELNLSGWLLVSGNQYFMIPKNTFISSGKKIIISSEITGFKNGSAHTVSLLYPNKVTAHTYTGQTGNFTTTDFVGSFVGGATSDKTSDKNKVFGTSNNSNIVGGATSDKISNTTKPEELIYKKEEKIVEITQQEAFLGDIEFKNSNDSSFFAWMSGVLALIFISIFGVFALKGNRNLADEFIVTQEKVEND